MIVYGDRERRVQLSRVLGELEGLCLAVENATPPRQREACTRLLIEAGSVAQALSDREQRERGVDHHGQVERVSLDLCLYSAQGLLCALGQRAPDRTWLQGVRGCLGALAAWQGLELTLREPEGYAHYGLYPEQYLSAAQACRAEHACASFCVIGIRSIGTSLGALVSETLGAQLFCTVRPLGHPYARTLHLGAELEGLLREQAAHARYAIVDEGPGRSGSSFGAVFRWLSAHDVAPERICFFPSHAGEPGSHGDAGFRRVYASATRHCVSFEHAVLDGAAESYASWFGAALDGPLRCAPRDLSGGLWRSLLYAREADYPASYVSAEARKLLLCGQYSNWLVKQVGLGRSAASCIAHKRTLAESGLCPELRAERHGFVLLRWHGAARPLDACAADRGLLVATVARYLGFLAAHLPTPESPGARPSELFGMLRTNTQQLLADAAALEGLVRLERLLPALESSFHPVVSDNKLDAHEWLSLPEGRILKCDAVEHSRAHDLIGCQDPAWDLAGAKVELELTEPEFAQLLAALHDQARLSLGRDKLAFYELAYLAFRAGHAQLAHDALLARWPDDAARMSKRRERYVERLQALLT